MRWTYNGVVPFEGYVPDFDTIGRDARETLAHFDAQPLKDTSHVNERTEEAQERAWSVWSE